jgi:hypothetical protein
MSKDSLIYLGDFLYKTSSGSFVVRRKVCGKSFYKNFKPNELDKAKKYRDSVLEEGKKLNKEKKRERDRKWYRKNKEKINKAYRERWSSDPKYRTKKIAIRNKSIQKKMEEDPEYLEKLRIYRQEHYQKNKDKYQSWHREWNKKNPEKRRAMQKKYEKTEKGKSTRQKSAKKRFERIRHTPEYKIEHALRERVRKAVARDKGVKQKLTKELIGCDINTLKSHLESQFQEGMNWENHGSFGWHIDHIIPCTAFDLTKEEEQKKCFHYKNLQPLWWKENIQKSNKIL